MKYVLNTLAFVSMVVFVGLFATVVYAIATDDTAAMCHEFSICGGK